MVNDPSRNLGSRFGTAGVRGFWNRNSNIVGAQGLVPDDGPGGGDGYEVAAFSSGANLLAGPRAVADPFRARAGRRGVAVELAVQRAFLDAMKLNDAGVDVSGDVNEIGLRATASAAGIDPAAFNLNDRFGRRQSGSPYPFLRLRPARDPSSCPTGEAGLSLADREALDSGTSSDTGIANPCYPSGAVAALDNSYYLQTTYTPVVANPPAPAASQEPAEGPTARRGPPAALFGLVAMTTVAGSMAIALRRRERRKARSAKEPGTMADHRHGGVGGDEGQELAPEPTRTKGRTAPLEGRAHCPWPMVHLR